MPYDPRRDLGLVVTRSLIERIRDTARAFDINRGGHADNRSGCVNWWCSPDDHPACWTAPIWPGGLDYPRDLVGTLDWDWPDQDHCRLYVEASPYELLDHLRRTLTDRPMRERVPSPADWAQILDWLEEKARELVRLADLAPSVVGVACPFCDWVLPSGRLLNELVAHVAAQHEPVTQLVLGDTVKIGTLSGVYALRPVESFAAD